MTARIGFGVRGLALPAAVATLSFNAATGAEAKDDSATRLRIVERTGR